MRVNSSTLLMKAGTASIIEGEDGRLCVGAVEENLWTYRDDWELWIPSGGK